MVNQTYKGKHVVQLQRALAKLRPYMQDQRACEQALYNFDLKTDTPPLEGKTEPRYGAIHPSTFAKKRRVYLIALCDLLELLEQSFVEGLPPVDSLQPTDLVNIAIDASSSIDAPKAPHEPRRQSTTSHRKGQDPLKGDIDYHGKYDNKLS